tara:strand:+ start:1110 stop:2033 length:924 start_codon:yes stop_codon:yes gene_type:complete
MTRVTLQDKLKFILITVVAGTGWYVIPSQITHVGTEYAIAYRMLLAGLAIVFFALSKKISFPRFSRQSLGLLLISGIFLYSLNYLFIYQGLKHLPSGIGSLVISAVIIPNAILGRWILKTPLKPQTLVGACLSLAGLAVLFPGDIFDFDLSIGATLGFLALCFSLFLSSFGTVMTSKLIKEGVNLYWATALAMLLGGTLSFGFGLYQHQEILWSNDMTFISLLLYIGLLVTSVVFVFYMQLVNKFGAASASYIWIIAPVIALNISSIFEGMQWTLERIVATVIILMGGCVALKKTKRKIKIPSKSPV